MSKPFIKSVFTSLLLFFLVFNVSGKKDTVAISKAFLKKIIKLDIKGKGGFQGECLSMKIKNNSADSILIFIEAGWRFDSSDSTMQDILVVKDQYLPLAKKQEKTFGVEGFCCQAHKSGPAEKSKFAIGDSAKGPLRTIAKYLSKIKVSISNLQHAIWVVSDNNDLSSVEDDGTEPSKKLREFISKLKGIEIPWYNTKYKNEPGPAFSGKPKYITAKLNYSINNDLALVMANIRDEAGTIVKSFMITKGAMRGEYTFDMDWDVSNMPKGKYYLRVYENQRELLKQIINLK
jgi:hypothetical protein